MGAPGVIGDRRYVSWKTMFPLESFSIYILGFYSSKDHMVQLKCVIEIQEPNLLIRFTRLVTHWETAEFRLTNVYVNNSPSFLYFIKIFLENIVGKLNIVQISVLVFVF